MKGTMKKSLLRLFRAPSGRSSSSGSIDVQSTSALIEPKAVAEHFAFLISSPINIGGTRKRYQSSGSENGDEETSRRVNYMLVDLSPEFSKSAPVEESTLLASLDNLDRVPVDFSCRNGPTLITDSEQIGEMLTHGEPSETYSKRATIFGLAPCAVYRAERWFHQNVDRERAERMLLNTGCKDGSFLIRVNNYNCLVITVCYRKQFFNVPISCKVHGHITTLYIEREHQFSNLFDLIIFYTEHAGAVLPCRLVYGVALKWPSSKSNGSSQDAQSLSGGSNSFGIVAEKLSKKSRGHSSRSSHSNHHTSLSRQFSLISLQRSKNRSDELSRRTN